MHVVAWILSAALTIFLLVKAPPYGAGFVIKRAIGAIVAGILLVVTLGLVLRGLAISPSHVLTTALFQCLMTVVIMAMLNGMNVVFHSMVEAQIAFHQRFNAANLHRFPISFLIEQRQGLKAFGTIMWCLGAVLMLYGVWFDMQV